MFMFEILQLLSKCNTEAQSEQMLLKIGSVATNLQLADTSVCAQDNKARYACIPYYTCKTGTSSTHESLAY